MSESCNSCAFREGCATHEDEPYNRLRAEICAISAIPFYCHKTVNWREIDRRSLTPEQAIALRRQMPICQGWKARVAKLFKRKPSRENNELRRLFGMRALELIDEAIRAKEPEKTNLFKELERVIVLLRRPARAGRAVQETTK